MDLLQVRNVLIGHWCVFSAVSVKSFALLRNVFNKCILDASSFSDIYILKIQFSYSEACPFVFSVAPFKEQF